MNAFQCSKRVVTKTIWTKYNIQFRIYNLQERTHNAPPNLSILHITQEMYSIKIVHQQIEYIGYDTRLLIFVPRKVFP